MNKDKEHSKHKEYYDKDCSICKLEQRFNDVLSTPEFKHLNPFD